MTDISAAFIKQFESEVHLKYQQEASLLRNMVRYKNNVRGSTARFQIIGKGDVSTKQRHGEITPMGLDHSFIDVTLVDSYAGEYIDKLDELKTNIDERSAVAKSEAYAMGRKTDEHIINALASATGDVVDASTTGLTLAKVLEAFERANNAEMPDDGDRYAVVSPKAWNQLLLIDQFARSDFVDDKPFMKGRMCKKWLGINWFMHTGLPTSNNDAVSTAFIWHKNAIGFASGSDVKTEINYIANRASNFVCSMMSQGAGLIDNDGVVKISVKNS